jgi:nitrite reductase/ring-hydroxylating ferredoxin subunit
MSSPQHETAVDPLAVGSRRDFIGDAAALSMFGGLVAGYGSLAYYAGQFLFSTTNDTAWLFVSDVPSIAPGDSLSFESPTGVKVVITRKKLRDENQEVSADDFLALSSVCPHLGCRVHWESKNNRFFCPCHNGEFDPNGKATGGPPKAANQELPRYPVMVQNGMLFIEMPLNTVGTDRGVFLETAQRRDDGSGAAFDPSGSQEA